LGRIKIPKKIQRAYYGFIAIVPFILLVMPADFFDEGQSICVSVLLAGVECYACGLTRGMMHLIHFEFAKAWEYNQLTFIVALFIFPYWLNAVYEFLGKDKPKILKRIF